MEQVIPILITAVLTGAVSALSTVTALRVHIKYLNDAVNRKIGRAHV